MLGCSAARLLDAARAGRADALVVLGEPGVGKSGVGKSALLDEVIERRDGFRLLRTLGLESEAPLAFAALRRLLHPVQDLIVTDPDTDRWYVRPAGLGGRKPQRRPPGCTTWPRTARTGAPAIALPPSSPA